MSDKKLKQTPSQTLGPYFAYSLTPEQYLYDFKKLCDGNLILNDDIKGERISIFGQIFDGEGVAINDAMVEIWQANAEGIYLKDPDHFMGFGRTGTGAGERLSFEFQTIKPGQVDGQAPHINVIVLMRGLLSHLYTRIYFPDEEDANANDEVLNSIDKYRQDTIIAKKVDAAGGFPRYEFNIHLQGENETVFFDV